MAGKVVRRGPQASRDDGDVGTVGDPGERCENITLTVAHGGVSRDLETESRELFGEERRIRVGDSPCHQLAADGEDLRGHFWDSDGGPAPSEAEGSPGRFRSS